MRAKTSQSEGANEQNQHGDAAVIKTSDGASGCGVDECADNALCEAIRWAISSGRRSDTDAMMFSCECAIQVLLTMR